jgi:hypothetical protein
MYGMWLLFRERSDGLIVNINHYSTSCTIQTLIVTVGLLIDASCAQQQCARLVFAARFEANVHREWLLLL